MPSNITDALAALGPGPWRAASCESGGEDDVVLDSGGLYSARCACASSAKHLADILNYARECMAREPAIERLREAVSQCGENTTYKGDMPEVAVLNAARRLVDAAKESNAR